ncbi:MAG: phosphoribosylformylglycinamidine synthase subunit PurS, partial [Deltaproteobacteria bacterium]|nr:phosphoribosylformylglycinamidine synthase subunit PurS [Deltaproteobacteria bacterium]
MPHRLEIALKPGLFDAIGEGVRQKAKNYFGLEFDEVRTVNIITIDADLTGGQLKTIQHEIFTNPVTEVSSFEPLDIDF